MKELKKLDVEQLKNVTGGMLLASNSRDMPLLYYYKPKFGGALLLALITLAGQLLGSFVWVICAFLESLISGEKMALSADNMNILLVYVVSFIPVAFFIWRRSLTFKAHGEAPVPLNAFHTSASRNFSAAIVTCLVVLLTFCLIILIEPIERLMPESEALKQIFYMIRQRPVNAALSVCIAAPILEELVCRGFIMRGLLQHYRPWLAIVISAFLFAAIHGNLAQGVTAFLLGLLLGWVYYRTGSLLLSMMIHFIVNTSSTVLALIPSIPEDATLRSLLFSDGPALDYYIFFAFVAVLAVAIIAILHKNLPSSTSLKPAAPETSEDAIEEIQVW